MMTSQAKAVVAAIIAVLATFGDTLATTNDPVTWRTIVAALVAAVVAHQGTYWTTNTLSAKQRVMRSAKAKHGDTYDWSKAENPPPE